MMRNGLLTILFLLLFCQGASAAETVYVIDQLRLGVRPVPNASESSIAVVSTGDALTILGEEEGFIQIRTEGGIEGWVSKGYVSAEPPARNQLKLLQADYETLQQKYETLQQQYHSLQQQPKPQEAEISQQVAPEALAQLQRDNAELKAQLEHYAASDTGTKENAGFLEHYRWLLLLALLLASLLAGLITGVRWKARQVAERIGGLQL